ncbi:prostasin-like protein, partial [Aphelenchoides avenae]
MLQWLVFAGSVSTVATALECGRVPLDDALESRVVGGHAPAEGNWPFLVYVQDDAESISCSGSIIGPLHVLTAAHCVDNDTYPIPESINASHFRVRTGSIRSSYEDGLVDDVAILELDTPIKFDDYAQPICLPKSFRERPGEPGYFVGWGKQNNVSDPHDEATDYIDESTVANENIVTFQKWSLCG